ncbi:MAG: helix-turn-helix domain-containing protein [Lachnospiraceae bacterium]|nr:helix-turn-helix domain-containing protein [Lachnospiraceae bacterium]
MKDKKWDRQYFGENADPDMETVAELMEYASYEEEDPADGEPIPSNTMIGIRIRNKRMELEMTQEDFARLIGISASYLSAIERGKRRVSAKLCTAIRDNTGLSCDYILTGQSDELHYNYDRGFSPFPAEVFEEGRYLAGSAKSISPAKKRLALLFNTCTDEEAYLCYNVCHAMLAEVRMSKPSDKKRKKRK